MNEETTTILIDTALASGAASALDPEERRLQELVLQLRDDAPSPDPAFELRMNARVAAGFPARRRDGVRGRMRALLTTRPQLATMAAAASLLVALVVAVSIGTNGRGTTTSVPEGSTGAGAGATVQGGRATSAAPAAPAAAQKAAPAAGATSSESVAPIPGPPVPGDFVGGPNRRVERSAALVLAPAKDRLNEVGDQVIAVTDRYRGIVMSSSITSSAEQGSGGSFDLRIPVGNLQPALRDLSALADVQSRTENGNDVTASFVGARTRLQELNAERRGLLRRLANAATDRAAGAIRAQLRLVNAQIQAQAATLTDMKRRTSYAAVSVTLQPKQGGSGGGGGIGKGARDLRDSLVAAANLALRVLGVALPIALLVALFWLGSSRLSRRRREAALD